MNHLFLQRAIFLLSLTAVASGMNNLAAKAETPEAKISGNYPWMVAQTNQQLSTNPTFGQENSQQTSSSRIGIVDKSNFPPQIDSPGKSLTNSSSLEKSPPVPGTTFTSAASLLGQPVGNSKSPTSTSRTENSSNSNSGSKKETQVAQYEIEPGRETRSGSSYVGAGGNIGLTGESAIGDNGFALFSKIGLTRVLSVRPMFVFSNDTDIIIPVTYDFPIAAEPFQRINLAPFVGAGVIITTYRESNFGAVLTGGIDIPIGTNFTAVGSVTVAFVDTTSVGLLLGVAYNFGRGFSF
ncbi:hypothetical protein ACE1B6_02430 [Aerosakkonemataceae cyanobacterium BLCC-F154]|uniref:Outer membrane protein beta-barrel domain-containing protein n=1 Tax=Floridaenema fluviatile BLCC-F154 TaxID=3153640 RepID=A0ABV4Y861_9CYAN